MAWPPDNVLHNRNSAATKKNKKERETVQKSLESCINWAMTERHEDGPAMPVIKTAGYRVWYTDEAL